MYEVFIKVFFVIFGKCLEDEINELVFEKLLLFIYIFYYFSCGRRRL